MAKIIKPLDKEQFAEIIYAMKDGEEISFATTPGIGWPNKIPERNNCECWYFAKKMFIPGYDSRFVLIDYAGGEEAFAIPFNNYKETADMDDRYIIPPYIDTFWAQCRGDIVDFVFMEVEE